MDEDGPGATERRLHKLQHTKSGDGHIILVPQPSLIDPNDPLRWLASKKWTVLANGIAYAFSEIIYLIRRLVSPFIIQTLSMWWAFFIIAIPILINQITLIFSTPETIFTGIRPQIMGEQITNQSEEVKPDAKTEVKQIERSLDGNDSASEFNVQQKT
jgi:hypothetical protein